MVGSEDDDQDYTPRRSKRKRTASLKSPATLHRSDSIEQQEEDDARQQLDTLSSPTETMLPETSNGSRKGESRSSSAILVAGSENLRRPMSCSSIAISTQDSLGSASDSQSTVDVM